MIQRIQTVYLLIGALALLSLLLFDSLWTGPITEDAAWFAPSLVISAVLAAIVAIVSIFLYKNRTQQRRIVGVAQLLTLICLVVLAIGLYLGGSIGSAEEGWTPADFVILLVPIIAYIMFWLARRSIDQDIALIRSMDRLR